jgi:hypothetical protein
MIQLRVKLSESWFFTLPGMTSENVISGWSFDLATR